MALRARGHSVSLAVSETYQELAETHGLAFHALVSVTEHQELFEHPDFWNPLKTVPLAARWGTRFLRRQYELFAKLATPGTVLVANPGLLAAGLIHEKLGVPWTNLILQPWMIPSSLAPPIMPGLSFLAGAPRPVWKLVWRGLDCVGDCLIGRELNALRASLGLKPIRRVFQNWLSRERVIGMFPDWFGPPQADWPPQTRLTGFPMVDGGKNELLPPDVLEFCRAGSPPVVFTFGTGMAHSAHLFRTALEAVAILGIRAILLTKYRDQLPGTLPPSVLHCAFAPFQKLFPQCAAVVHHGGIGTVAKALGASLPQLVLPLCFDQTDNGLRVMRLCAGDCLRTSRPTGKQIARALQPLLTAQARAQCARLQARFDGGDALALSADLVENLAVEHRPLPAFE
jgi:UDP:flavonoid glycosyltransferase YjiC (YdhE family)